MEYCEGPQLVIAGAGSGKTRVLTYKIAYLLENGMLPWSILALTFTNKAAREMKSRIGDLVGESQAQMLHMGTFHSIFARLLRGEAQNVGYTSNFTIYDQSDSRSLIKGIIKEMGLDEKTYKPASVADRISMAKNRLITAQQYAMSPAALDDARRRKGALKDVYIRYAERCRQANAMDFDDLLLYTYILFCDHEDVRLKYSDRYDYVLVDEYQDTNYAQQEIVRQLTKEKRKVCVVGDDAQSIYSFRGAEIHNILQFQKIYPGSRLFKLEQNYRSTQSIVAAANSLIKRNTEQIPKTVFSEKETGDPIIIKSAYSDKEEAAIVCLDIKRFRQVEGMQYSDFAILYRTNAQSRSFEEQMRRVEIPYRIYGGLSFYQRKEIKDSIAYFRLVSNPNDEEALKRIINYPARGIGNTTLSRIVECANDNRVSPWTVLSDPLGYGLQVSGPTLQRLDTFRQMVESWRNSLDSTDAYSLGKEILAASGLLKDIYSSNDAEDISRQENVDELMAGMADFVNGRREEGQGNHVSLSDYLQEVALLTDLDSNSDSDEPKVTLMTIHSAKGLEFDTVFVVGMEENIFPSPMAIESPRGLEEERRLFYVAITRAQRHCILTFAQNRIHYGRLEFDSPSRFLKDIDRKYLKIAGGISTSPISRSTPAQRRFVPIRQASYGSQQINAPSASSVLPHEGVGIGAVMEHQRFGVGKIIAVEGTGENTKVTVEFRNVGKKQLLLKFAKFKIIGQ